MFAVIATAELSSSTTSAFFSASSAVSLDAPAVFEAVSYTHLDVYKRQSVITAVVPCFNTSSAKERIARLVLSG